MRSHCQVHPSNVKGVGCIQPPIGKRLHQDAIGRTLQKQAHDGLEASHTHQSLGNRWKSEEVGKTPGG